jgi:MFS family permease
LFDALIAYRFLVGVNIGGEYPAGSVGAAESTGDLEEGSRNRWFIFATDVAIDAGFVVAALVPMLVLMATGPNHLEVAWRVCLGIGAIPPLSLLYLRMKLQEPEAYKQGAMTGRKMPVVLALKVRY